MSETLNIYTTNRLGKIERAVLHTIAASTWDNGPVYSMSGDDLMQYEHSHAGDTITRSELYVRCGHALSHLSHRSAYSAFGRALHNLFDKGLVNGYALGWHLIEKDSDGKVVHDDLVEWAGPGRPSYRKRKRYSFRDKSPVLKVVLLSEAGWEIARQDMPDVGLCPRCKEYLSLCRDKL